MPNHIENKLIICASGDSLEDIKKFVKGTPTGWKEESLFNFETIIPVPPWYMGGHILTEDEYRWCVKNWGTKWNAYNVNIECDNVLTFQTAWSNVGTIIKKLSSLFPNITFIYSWADEDIGNNVGTAIFRGGVSYSTEFFNGSTAAYEFAFWLWPEDSINYKLIDGKYKHFEEDEGVKNNELD